MAIASYFGQSSSKQSRGSNVSSTSLTDVKLLVQKKHSCGRKGEREREKKKQRRTPEEEFISYLLVRYFLT